MYVQAMLQPTVKICTAHFYESGVHLRFRNLINLISIVRDISQVQCMCFTGAIGLLSVAIF